MTVLRTLKRPRWLVAVACLALLVPVAFVVSGVASAEKQELTSQTRPLVDRDYIYRQLFDMSYNDVYRVSGADGPPNDPSSPWNEPPTVNGWQEFFQHWKQQLTDTSVMGPLAKFGTVSDHYFHRLPEQRTNPNYTFNTAYPWDSDDAEVTVPGAACPGQRVLLAAHPDGTPVTPAIVGEVNNPQNSTSPVFGFGAGRRTLTLSNVANGGAYDDTSGVTLTMGEYQALLRWYDANGTFPSKTLKVALLDASAGRAADGTYLREGAKYYASHLIPQGPQGQYAMFAEMNANGMSYPAYHLGTQYYWNNTANGGVGPWRTFITDTPPTPNALYPDTGPASPGANITANAPAISQFDTNLKDAVTAGFAQQSDRYGGTVPQENPLRYNGTGSAPGGLNPPAVPSTPDVPAYTASDQATFSPVHAAGTAVEAQESTHEDEASIFWNLGIPGFSVGGVQDSNIDENPYPATTDASIRSTPVLQYTGGGTAFELASNVPTAGMTVLTATTASGDTTVTVASSASLIAGQPFFVDTGLNLETGVISSISGNTVTLNHPLQFAHPNGARFHVNQGQPVGFTGDTLEHLNVFASGAPHGLDGENSPTEELLRALELPAEYTSLLVSSDDYLGAVPKAQITHAYFESDPVNPTSTTTVTFDASFARDWNGNTGGLTYFWDFGDATHATGKTVTHTYASPMWADVKLVVIKGDTPSQWGMYRQAVAIDSPSGSPPSTPACGTFSPAERAALIAAAQGGGSTTQDAKAGDRS
jgi:PKD domain